MRSTLPCALAVLAVCLLPAANAGTMNAIYAFGDSLSDTGNDYFVTGGTEPGTPYFSGRFSNGPIWIDHLAASLGLPIGPSQLGGTDFAYGGAETGVTPVHPVTSFIDLLGSTGQIAQFTAANPSGANPNALYTIWIGSNDLADVLSSNPDSAQLQTDIGAIVGNIDTSILDLATLGARNFLVLTVPDLGKTPAALTGPPGAAPAASLVSGLFDSALAPSLDSLAAGSGLTLNVLDTYALLDSIVANGASFGFTDTTDACLTGEVNFAGGTPCSANAGMQNQYVFWDDKHPTSAAQALVGEAALTLVTPEPPSWLTLAAGILAICGLMRWRRQTSP